MGQKRSIVSRGSVGRRSRKRIPIIPKRNEMFQECNIARVYQRIEECKTKECLENIRIEVGTHESVKRITRQNCCSLFSRIDERRKELGLDV